MDISQMRRHPEHCLDVASQTDDEIQRARFLRAARTWRDLAHYKTTTKPKSTLSSFRTGYCHLRHYPKLLEVAKIRMPRGTRVRSGLREPARKERGLKVPARRRSAKGK